MTIEQALQVGQMALTFLAFGGIVFGMGRIVERLGGVESGEQDTRLADLARDVGGLRERVGRG